MGGLPMGGGTAMLAVAAAAAALSTITVRVEDHER